MNAEFFEGNRQALLDRLGRGALVVVTGYGEMQRGNDAAHLFEQEANFWYLTGIEAPDWWLIMDGSSGVSWLVRPNVEEMQQIFDGSLDAKAAGRVSGVKHIITRDEALIKLRALTKTHSVVYTVNQSKLVREHTHFQLNTAQSELYKLLERTFQKVQDCYRDVAILRTIKQPEEIAAIEKAIKITNAALKLVYDTFDTYKGEYEIEADLTRHIRRTGAAGHAYSPIIAAGKNACTLHYHANNDKLVKKQLVLIDVGARVDGYAADISRTYAFGQATKRQREIHEIVQKAQTACIKLLKPGLRFDEYQTSVDTIMTEAVVAAGFTASDLHTYFPHAVSHGLGVDVHDTLAGYETLEPGMVLTVEPGIYIPEEGIGVRIEDDILITDTGHRNLSRQLSTDL
jgi:Xaa-Pro aminopeptidase